MRGSKRKGHRPGTWELRVDAGRDPLNGKRQQRSITFEGTSREADVKLAELISEASRGHVAVGSRTMSDLLDAGLEQAEAEGLERTTLRGYRRVADCQIRPALGKRRITHLGTEEIDRFYAALAKKGYSASTIKQTHAVLCRVLDTAIRWGWIGDNPARRASKPKVAAPAPRPVPVEMIRELVEGAEQDNPDLAACLFVAADTGARRGELCALRWSKVDLDSRRLRIDRSIGEDGNIYEKDTKNHQHRTISISPESVEVLRRHRTRAAERALACGVSLEPDAFVFSDAPDSSGPWWPSRLTKRFRLLCQRLELPDWVKLHGLRHTQVTELLDAGLPVRTVAGRVGHRNSSTTTNIYSHWVEETDERAADIVSERIWQRQPRRAGE